MKLWNGKALCHFNCCENCNVQSIMWMHSTLHVWLIALQREPNTHNNLFVTPARCAFGVRTLYWTPTVTHTLIIFWFSLSFFFLFDSFRLLHIVTHQSPIMNHFCLASYSFSGPHFSGFLCVLECWKTLTQPQPSLNMFITQSGPAKCFPRLSESKVDSFDRIFGVIIVTISKKKKSDYSLNHEKNAHLLFWSRVWDLWS